MLIERLLIPGNPMDQAKSGLRSSLTELQDITPKKYACTIAASCPAIFKDAKTGSYVIIGKNYDITPQGLGHRVGGDEAVIRISADLIEDAIRPRRMIGSVRVLFAWVFNYKRGQNPKR